MTLRRIPSTLLLALVALLATATPALAHTELQGSNPPIGAALATTPQQVSLTFGEAVTLPADSIQVAAPQGARWTVGTAPVSGIVVGAPVQPAGPAAATPAQPAAGSVRASPQAEDTNSSIPGWVWIVIIIPIGGMLVIAAIVAVRRRFSSGRNR